MSLREASLVRDRIINLSLSLRKIAEAASPEDAAKIHQAATALVDLWEDRRFAREQFCLLESLEAAGRKVISSPEEVAASMGWPVAMPGRYFPEMCFSKEEAR